MRLSDQILAARGGPLDLMGFASSLGALIAKAQRFELSDEVARACGELVYSRPSSLLAALPLCRLPYETTWIEFRGGLGNNQASRRDFDGAPVPSRQGALIESMPGGQVGFMTFAWVHNYDRGLSEAVNMTPIGVFFDWRPDGDVRQIVRIAHNEMVKEFADARTRPFVRSCSPWSGWRRST